MRKVSLLLPILLLASYALIGQVYRLDELDLRGMETGWGSPQANKTVDGNPLKVAGITYEYGVGTHSISHVLIKLNGKGLRFESLVGVDDETQGKGTVEFLVLGDKRVLWRSGVMEAGDPAKEADVDITGVNLLGLLVLDAGDQNYWDHADWLMGSFLMDSYKPSVVMSQSKPYILTPPAPLSPRFNGPDITGGSPNKPFLYKIPVSGKKPMTFTIKGLPKGLTMDKDGVIRGSSSKSGKYKLVVTAANEHGKASKKITLVLRKDALALTPPMGWNSWNCWGLDVTQQRVADAGRAMIEKGLSDYGWSYINIDDGWEADKRLSDGSIACNEKFPDMSKLSKELHAEGLKLGIYSSPGPLTCGGYVGSLGHEKQDAETYSSWGIDYLKYDWCSYGETSKKYSLEEYQAPYLKMEKALRECDRDIVYSLCQYGMGNVWEWGEKVGGNLWRTTGDITDSWASLSSIGFSQDKAAPYLKPGHWNDPDMLIVGQVGWSNSLHPTRLTPDEQYTHISLWALQQAPLLIGCDMTQLDDFTLSLLTNHEVLAVNQDVAAFPVKRILLQQGVEAWLKKLSDGSWALGIFYVGSTAISPEEYFAWDQKENLHEITVNIETLGLKKAKYKVRDLWRQRDLGESSEKITVKVPYHGVVLVRLKS